MPNTDDAVNGNSGEDIQALLKTEWEEDGSELHDDPEAGPGSDRGTSSSTRRGVKGDQPIPWIHPLPVLVLLGLPAFVMVMWLLGSSASEHASGFSVFGALAQLLGLPLEPPEVHSAEDSHVEASGRSATPRTNDDDPLSALPRWHDLRDPAPVLGRNYTWAELTVMDGFLPNTVSFKTANGEYLGCDAGLLGEDYPMQQGYPVRYRHNDGSYRFRSSFSFVVEDDSDDPYFKNIRASTDESLYWSVLSLGVRCKPMSSKCPTCTQFDIRRNGSKVNFFHKGSAMFLAFGTVIFPTVQAELHPDHFALLKQLLDGSMPKHAEGDLLKVVKGLALSSGGMDTSSIVPPYRVVSLKVAGVYAERYIRHFAFQLAAETNSRNSNVRNPLLWAHDTSFYMVPLGAGMVAFASVNYPWLWMSESTRAVGNLDITKEMLGFRLHWPNVSRIDECMLRAAGGRGDVVIERNGGHVSRLQLKH